MANWLTILVVFFSLVAKASEVLKVSPKNSLVAVTESKEKPWKVKDGVCISRGGKDLACGMVVRTVKGAAIAKVSGSIDEIMPGDKATYTKDVRKLANTTTLKASQSYSRMNLALGADASTTFFYPVIDFEFAVSRN